MSITLIFSILPPCFITMTERGGPLRYFAYGTTSLLLKLQLYVLMIMCAFYGMSVLCYIDIWICHTLSHYFATPAITTHMSINTIMWCICELMHWDLWTLWLLRHYFIIMDCYKVSICRSFMVLDCRLTQTIKGIRKQNSISQIYSITLLWINI